VKYFLILTLGLLAVACSSETKEEIKDLNDILPGSERDYDKKDAVVVEEADTLGTYQNRFAELGTLDSISAYDEDLFPDRFGPKAIEKYQLSIAGENVVFVKWRFSDSARVSNALFNWLDCFGPKCKSIRVAEERNLQSKAFHVFANDSVLIYLESENRLDTRNWDKYFDKSGYELEWDFIMEQTPKGRVRWFTYQDEEKTPVKKEIL
jgi:hypothetical protein